ncbi:MAG: hypothetical protein EOO60_02670 [Hymenobacter sp.]|nr:MAG: hypothetical protein EOO60_02670 [Hymenobacter sp.]
MLIGLILAVPAWGLMRAGLPRFYYTHLAGLPGLPPVYVGGVTAITSKLAWAWIGLGISWSYGWHTRRLLRSTPAGRWAYRFMWLLYTWLFMLAGLVYFSIPDYTPSDEPFFG